MNPVDIIVKKRDGLELSRAEIRYFVNGFVQGTIPDYQVAAWAMAIFFQGMSDAETTELTLAMAESGEQIDLHDALPEGTVIVDKHSSGGVGDKTTLAVAPIVAACGLPVGKMSGRGLSFSGGTIDKLESFTGFRAELSEAEFRRQLSDVGLVVAAQTANLAPADKTLYALRDVTGTVPSLPLIASSIMSKKLAAGADAIVLDVKTGRGSFMPELDEARRLARLMVATGTRAGRKMRALITQMDQPLGHAVGNALEVREAIETLQGKGPADFTELVETLAAEMLVIGSGKEASMTHDTARKQVREAVESGAALAKFREFIAAQGGDIGPVDNPERFEAAPVTREVRAERGGYVASVDAQEIGLTVVDLGGGRRKKGDAIDHRVGILAYAKVGSRVQHGDLLATIHAADEAQAEVAADRVRAAVAIQDAAVEPLPIIYEALGPE